MRRPVVRTDFVDIYGDPGIEDLTDVLDALLLLFPEFKFQIPLDRTKYSLQGIEELSFEFVRDRLLRGGVRDAVSAGVDLVVDLGELVVRDGPELIAVAVDLIHDRFFSAVAVERGIFCDLL